jgi:queuine/archaeosine tRNA-ribosyltransferase
MLAEFPCDMAFSFDEQNPPSSIEDHVALISGRWKADQAVAKNCQFIPIIHGSVTDLPTLCAMVAAKTGISMLAVPERRLGAGILERARTVQAIRSELNILGRYVVLHLLGTGNPISITLYSAMGADSFDGLEWCQTVVDCETGVLYHFSQADFFAGQTEWSDADLSFQARTLAHNLEFFSDWMQRLREAINSKQLSKFCRFNFSSRIFQHFANINSWT